jgi:hypothetical protein
MGIRSVEGRPWRAVRSIVVAGYTRVQCIL